MSFTDNYLELRKKKKEEVIESSGDSFTEKYLSLTSEDDIAPVLTSTTIKKSADNSKLDFFQSGAFNDGYQFGDVTKTVLGTAGDIGLEAVKGATGIAEGLADLLLYGTAGVADLFGADDFAVELKEGAAKNAIEGLTKGADDFLEKYSVLGRTSDAILQGVGQVGAIIATGGLGEAAGLSSAGITALTTGTIGLSGMGSGMGEAYQGGATDGEAVTYGLISGASDALTELMFAGLGKSLNARGISKGLSSADDILAKKVSSLFNSQLAKNMAEFGIKASAEGFEEVVAGTAQAIGKKMTYMSEEDLGKILEDENLLEQFVVGAVTSGIAQSGDLSRANKTGTDFITGYNQNEQAVIKKEVENRIAEKEADGTKLSKKEKSDIEAQVEKDLERGYISTDTIEEVLGDKSIYDSLEAEANEYDTLYNTATGQLSKAQQDKLAELEEKNKANPYKDALKSAKDKYSQSVFDMVKGDRLSESYREKARVYEDFQADFSKYKGAKYEDAAKKTIESAIKAGANNTNRVHDLVDLAAKTSADTGKTFEFKSGEQITNDFIERQTAEIAKLESIEQRTAEQDAELAEMKDLLTKVQNVDVVIDGDITADGIVLNLDSNKPLNRVVGHEITHSFEPAKGKESKEYTELRDSLFAYAKTKGIDIDSEIRTRELKYKGVTNANAETELVADLVGDYLFTDSDYIKRLSVENRNLFRKLWDEVKYLCKIATAGSKEARELARVQKAFEDAYRAGGNTAAETGGASYSLAGKNKDGIEVYETSQSVMNLTWDERKAQYLNVMKNEYRGRTAKFERNGHTYYAKFDQASVRKPIYGDARSSTAGVKALIKAGADGDTFDLVENSQYSGSKQNTKTHTNADYFDYFVKTVQIDGKVFDLVADVEKEYGTDEGYVYTLALVDNKKIKASPALGTPNTVPVKSAGNASSGIISQESGTVNTQYSLSDSDGKQLTKEQQEFFKDSKMRDENGNLKVMYHGSQDAGFHVFDAKMSDDDTSFFFVDRNDVAASYSGTSETYEAKTIRSAEDMNNFLAEIGYDHYEAVEKDGKFELLENGDHVATKDTAQELYEEFCWYEGVGDGDANYKVYLNLKNPLEIDAKGRPWNKIDAEFSQDVYDKYNSLTAEEKAALVDLAEWEDFRIFNSEIQEARDNELASAYQKMGEDVNIYDLFSVASDNFSEESVRENARKYLKTRDFAQRAKEQGYDGVIFKNIVDNGGYSNGDEGASTVAIAFESSQIKSTANAKPTGDADIRYSLSDPKTDKNYLDAVSRGDMETAQKMVEGAAKESGYVVRAYHGTRRADRVGNVFLPERSTSGPMAFFTDSKDIAEHYAKDKADTSLAYDEEYADYYSQFRVNKNGKSIKVQDLWHSLPFAEKQRLKEAGKHITWDDDMTNIVWDDDATHGLGNWDAYTLNLHKGNAIEALIDCWLESGELFGNESDFIQVLEMAGIKGVEYRDPDARYEKVYDTFLNIQNPFNTASVDDAFADGFEAWYSQQPEGKYDRDTAAADMWDKNSQTAESFLERLRGDIENGTSYAWTSIPDSMTDYLKHLGHDGIQDTGGKNGGETHTVWIPFSSEQVKSAEPVTYDDSGNVIPLSERFNPNKVDIRNSLSSQGEQFAPIGNFDVYGKDFRVQNPMQETVPETESVAPVTEVAADTPVVSEENATADELFPDDLAPVEQELEAERFASLEDADAPPEVERHYDSLADTTPIGKTDIADIAKEAKETLALKNAQMDDFRKLVEEYSQSENPSREQLFYDIKEKFGTYKERTFDQTISDAKKYLRTTKLYVSDTIKGDIADFADFKKRNRGKVILSANGGLDVDVAYAEMSGQWPHLFSGSIVNPTDQLLQMVDVANKSGTTWIEQPIDDNALWEVANDIADNVAEMKQLQKEADANQFSKEAFDSLVADADQFAPIAPAKPLAETTPDTDPAPIFDSKEKPGQTTMFEPPAPNTKVANVLTEGTAIQKEKSGIGLKWASALVDKGMVFENLSLETGNHEVQAKWNYALPSNTEARAQYFMENGAEGVPALKNVLKTAKDSGKWDEFSNYLYHVHNIDRMTLDVRFGLENKTVFGETVTADVSRAEVKKLEAANPEFKAWAEDLYAISRYLRNEMVKGNIISQETADWWEEKYPHYVPILRVDAKGQNVSVPLDTNKTGVNAPVKRATGGNSDIQPLDIAMAQRIEQVYRAIARNSFGIELKNTLGTTINNQLNNMDVDEAIDTIEAQEDHLLKPGTMGSKPTFTVFENGERVEFEITEDMYKALKPADGLLGYRNKALGKVGEVRRNLLTTWSPVFALYRNPLKDIQDVVINSQHAVKTYLNVPNAIYQMATGGKYATEYHQNGGKSNTYFDSRTNKFKAEDNFFKKAIGMPIRAIETAGEFIEEIPRLAEYIASRQEGRSVERSMLDAARVTTNFAAGGDFTKFLNSHGFTFLNAGVQGASQHIRNFREAKQQGLKGYTKVLAKYVIAGLPSILLNSFLWDDDEEYEELSDYVKQNYYVVAKTQDGKFVRIPKGRTAAVMGELMGQMENLVTGDDEVDFSTFNELFWNNIAPSNPVENNILAPVLQVASNTAWYGGDLVPSRLQDLPAEEQYDESTDSISKWLGEKTGFSPYKINYLLDQYSGGLGDVVLPMLTPEAESGDDSLLGNLLAPWKKEMTTDKVLNNQNPGDFYDLRDELEVTANGKNATEEDKMKSMYMDSVSWEMGDLYAQKREIQSGDLPDDEKYEAVREIQEQINELAKTAMQGYNNVKIDGMYSEVGNKRYNKDAESGKWYEIKEKNADGTANYYQKEQKVTKALGISYAEYWNNREEYNYAYDKPEQYALAQAVGGYQSYRGYTSALWDIKADKDKNGKSISGSRKQKVIDYINNMDADYYTKIILFKNEYNSDDTYNMEIINYLNSRDDISYKQMETILKYLGFEVDAYGNIYW